MKLRSNNSETIGRFLDGFGRRYRAYQWCKVAGWLVSFSLLWCLASCIVDRVVGLGTAARIAALLGGIVIGIGIAAWQSLNPAARRMRPYRAAFLVESREPVFAERLITVVSGWDNGAAVSDSLERNLEQQVVEVTRLVSPADLVSPGPVLRAWLVAVGLGMALLSLAFWPKFNLRLEFARVITPLADLPAPTAIPLLVRPGDVRVARNDVLSVRVDVQDNRVSPILYATTDGENWISYAMYRTRDGTFGYDFPVAGRRIRYYVTWADMISPTYTATVDVGITSGIIGQPRAVRYASSATAPTATTRVSTTQPQAVDAEPVIRAYFRAINRN